MRGFEDAVQTILDAVVPLDTVRLPLLDALGCVNAEEVIAPWSTPSCDNSAMDGYAVRGADCTEHALLKISGYVPAGAEPNVSLTAGSAIKIMTGAPIPANCDAVVPLEAADEANGVIQLKKPVAARQHIRFAGEDIRAGDTLVAAGHVIRPVDIGALASFGRSTALVYRKPRVAVLSTGDELVERIEDLSPGKVFDSNAWAIAASVQECGAIPVMLGIARDDANSTREKIEEGLRADVLITTAGVSAGDRDLVRATLDALGVREVFRGVRVKPGSPTCFRLSGTKPVFSLPGNPVASLITFAEFVRPALRKMLGHTRVLNPFLCASLGEEVHKNAGFARLLRVRIKECSGRLWAWSAGKQDTGVQKTLLHADGLALLPADRTTFTAGEEVQVQLLAEAAHYDLIQALNHNAHTRHNHGQNA